MNADEGAPSQRKIFDIATKNYTANEDKGEDGAPAADEDRDTAKKDDDQDAAGDDERSEPPKTSLRPARSVRVGGLTTSAFEL